LILNGKTDFSFSLCSSFFFEFSSDLYDFFGVLFFLKKHLIAGQHPDRRTSSRFLDVAHSFSTRHPSRVHGPRLFHRPIRLVASLSLLFFLALIVGCGSASIGACPHRTACWDPFFAR
jgi:hypothetical protein